MLERQPWDSLRSSIEEAGEPLDETLERLKRYARHVLEWNAVASNLLSHNDELRIVERHIRESIEPAAWMRAAGASGRWLDFGSGAGFPAIPLALLRIGERWSLVESRRPKALFLRKCIEDMALATIEAIHARLEILDPPDEPLDGFTSRATLRLGPTLELAARWVAPGGLACLWKGSRRHEELVEAREAMKHWELQDIHEVAGSPTAVMRFLRR